MRGKLYTNPRTQGEVTNLAKTASQLLITDNRITTSVSGLEAYVQSRGQNLVSNGNGLLGTNKNFSGFTFDGQQNYAGGGSFYTADQNAYKENDELIPVDPNLNYRMTLMAKSKTGLGKYYFGISMFDIDNLQIAPSMVFGSSRAIIQLAAELKVGDTTITLSSTDGIEDGVFSESAGHRHSIIFWGYKNSKGYVYPDGTYSRTYGNAMWNDGGVNRTTNVITLNKPWALTNPNDPQGIFRVGQKVSGTKSGGSYQYIAASNLSVPTSWAKFEGLIGGPGLEANNFFPGTAFIRMIFLVNRSTGGGVAGDNVWLNSLDFANIKAEDNAKVYTNSVISQTKDEVNIRVSKTIMGMDDEDKRILNFVNKVGGSVTANPHAYKVGDSSSLIPPATFTTERATVSYNNISVLDGVIDSKSNTTNGAYAQQLFSFDLIEHVQRIYGRIPGTTTTDKVTWLRNNISRLTLNWWGFGSGPVGNRATLRRWDRIGSAWQDMARSHTNNTSTLLTSSGSSNYPQYITDDGFFHGLAYAEASNGTVASSINTDYVELEVVMKTSIAGDQLVSRINLQPGTIQIDAKNVNITGAVSFSSFDNEAKAMLASGESQVLNRNHNFYDWPAASAYPTGYTAQAGSAPTRVISDNNTGYSAQNVVPASINTYYAQTILNQAYTEYATIQLTFKLVSGTIGGAGALFRLNNITNGILLDHPIKIADAIANPVLNKWYTITKIVKSTTDVNFGSYALYVMPAWSSLGTITAKTIQFDSVKVRPSTASEIQAFKSGSTIDSWASTSNTTLIDGGKIQTNTIDVNSLKAGTIDASKITVTNMSASNVTSGTLNASVVTVTNLNASNITSGTLSASRIAANSIVANKLFIGATNLVNDPLLDAVGTVPMDATTILANNGWIKSTSTPTVVDDTTYGRVLKFSSFGAAVSTMFANSFFVDPMKTYKITFRFKYSKSDGTTPTGSMYFGFNSFHSSAPTTEVANTGSYEYGNDTYNSTGTNGYFFITPKASASANAWQTVETYLYPSDFYGDRTKLKTANLPTYGAQRRVWFMSQKMNTIALRMLNFNQSPAYGDGVSNNDLYVSNLQVTEVDGGTLTATNIVTGTLNADLIAIKSAASGVTINESGVIANNTITGVNVTMNSTTGFEIKKGADSVFTVNTDGTLTAKNLKILSGAIEGSTFTSYYGGSSDASFGRMTLNNSKLLIEKQNNNLWGNANASIYYSTDYTDAGVAVYYKSMSGTTPYTLESYVRRSGFSVINAVNGVTKANLGLFVGDETNASYLYSDTKMRVSGTTQLELESAGSVYLESGTGDITLISDNGVTTYLKNGSSKLNSVPLAAGANEVTLTLEPLDTATGGLRLFSRKNGMGLYDMEGKYTFLRHQPSTSTTKRELLVASENLNLYANNILNMTVADSDGTNVSVMNFDGSKDTGGVWVELGGGSRTHIIAGEKNISPETDLGMGATSEVLILEANSTIQMYWGTNAGFVDNQGVVGTGGSFRPAANGRLTLGNDTFRWSTIYAVNALNTSDSSTKTNIIQLNDAEIVHPRFDYSHWEKEQEISPQVIYDEMKKMPLFLFEYKDIEGSSAQVGFMADQLLQDDTTGVASRFVFKETEESIASASTQSYVATLHVALQEEMKRNDVLEKKVENLESRLARLEELLGGQL